MNNQKGYRMTRLIRKRKARKVEKAGVFIDSHRSLSMRVSSPKLELAETASVEGLLVDPELCRGDLFLPSSPKPPPPAALLPLVLPGAPVGQEGDAGVASGVSAAAPVSGGAAIPAKEPANNAQQCSTTCQSSTPLVSSLSLPLSLVL